MNKEAVEWLESDLAPRISCTQGRILPCGGWTNLAQVKEDRCTCHNDEHTGAGRLSCGNIFTPGSYLDHELDKDAARLSTPA